MMRRALVQAEMAAALGEVPVGAVVCRGDEVIAEAHNRRELDKNVLAHAELLALGQACRQLGGWRLHECDLYVTLEPCPMCTGAIINARIVQVIFGTFDPKAGCLGSMIDLAKLPFNHQPLVRSGILQEECAALLKNFFIQLRKQKLS